MNKQNLTKGRKSEIKYALKEGVDNRSGITLIALVITIIVLLILAGVVIAMLTGENGILSRAGQASDNTKREQFIEQVKLAIMESQVLNDGVADYDEVFGKYFTSVPSSYTNMKTEITAQDKYGGYTVTLGEVLGEATTANSADSAIASLVAGEHVYFINANGDEVECVVLYDTNYNKTNGTNYGVQIITAGTVENLQLGNGTGSGNSATDETSFNAAKETYNNAISLLNTAAENYRATNPNLVSISTDARCVGTIPDNKNAKNSSPYSNDYSYFSAYNNQFEAGEYGLENEFFYIDWYQMGITGAGRSNDWHFYWLAGRTNYEESSSTGFGVPYIDAEGGLSQYRVFCSVKSDRTLDSRTDTYGLRPVFTLNPNITITETDGKKYIS